MMFISKDYTGLALDGETIRIARIRVEANKLRLLKLDQFSLVEPIKTSNSSQLQANDESDSFQDELNATSVFGFDESEEEIGTEDEMMALDMVDEADTGGAQSNEILLYNILNGIDSQNVNVGINVPAGDTIFQIIRDTNYKGVKKKDLIEDLENKLQSIYGQAKSSDNYAYEVRDDGSLVLASVEEESALLKLVNRADDLYSGKLTVCEVLPDEAVLVGLVRANYNLQPDEITGIIQFGPNKCRVVFLTGNKILQVSPVINEGTTSSSLLNTLASKILFYLDIGEIPTLNRLIVANNTKGNEAIKFLQKNFTDVKVSNFSFDEHKFDFEDLDPALGNSFTTAIGLAWAASGFENKNFNKLSLLPTYVSERQKIFKLQWHGIMLLALIFLAPIVFNYNYQQNNRLIESLSSELQTINAQITQIEPTVQATNKISNDLAQLRDKLVLLDTLSNGSREWQAKLDILNEGMDAIESTWITSMTQAQNGIFVEGYSFFRNRIPRVVNIFEDATLLNVAIEDIRDKEVYQFSILVNEFAADDSVYSLPKTDELKEILTNKN